MAALSMLEVSFQIPNKTTDESVMKVWDEFMVDFAEEMESACDRIAQRWNDRLPGIEWRIH